MKYTKKELVAKATSGEAYFFSQLFFERSSVSPSRKIDLNGKKNTVYVGSSDDGVVENEFVVAYDQNWGDGNDWEVALHFPAENINVLLEGYYSSQGDSELDSVSLSAPYDYTEVRYRTLTKEDIRDINLDEVMKTED